VYGAGKQVTVYDSLAGAASRHTQETVRTLAGKHTRVVQPLVHPADKVRRLWVLRSGVRDDTCPWRYLLFQIFIVIVALLLHCTDCVLTNEL